MLHLSENLRKYRILKNLTQEDMADLKNETPLMKIGTPDEVAEAVAFFALDASSFITGQTLGVDGGFAV